MRPTTAPDDNVIDLNAILDPGTVFEHPRDVVSDEARHPGLVGVRRLRHRVLPVAEGARRIDAPVTIDEILEALCALDEVPSNPPGGKPMRLRPVERAAA